jgi:uncharacterized membrane protein
MRRVILLLVSGLLLAYPFGVYYGVRYLEPRYIGLIVLVLVGARFLLARRHLEQSVVGSLVPSTLMVALLCVLLLIFNQVTLMYFKPVLINLVMLATFGYSLLYPPTIIERFARLSTPELSNDAIAYTQKVTIAWCLFFLFNGLVAAYTGLFTSLEIWTLYNGFIAYLMIGMLLAAEYFIRVLKRRGA